MTKKQIDIEQQSEMLRALYQELANNENAGAMEQADGLSEEEARYAMSQWGLIWRRFRRNKAALFGGVIVIIYYLVAAFGSFVAPYGLNTKFITQIYLPPQRIHLFDGYQLKPYVYEVTTERNEILKSVPKTTDKKLYIHFFAKGERYELFFGLIKTDIHLFQTSEGIVSILGTDRQGRDMFSRIVIGSQLSLTIGLVGVTLSLFIGTILGITSGYYGGLIDEAIQRLIEIVRAFPAIPLWMALSAAIPHNWTQIQTYFAITIILSLIGWTWLARQLRGLVLTIRESDYVIAAKLAGASDRRIIFKHLIPATFGQIIVVTTLSLPAMILAETSLSFLGLGLRPPTTSWGVLLKEVELDSLALYPWTFSPAFVMVIVILAFSFLGDGLRDAADPYTI